MRVIDLLALMQDYNRKTKVQLRTAAGNATVAKIQTAEQQEQPQLILVPGPGKALQLWEFAVLLDQKDRRLRYLYIQDDAALRPVFGFQEVAGVLVVN
ncbi:MAG: hypothetical protein LKJ29_07185 [Lactobacillus sp.]|jgi:hypothetical protein|uniref:hypothetical protein n=1 Tax=Lacticaseibacillus suilingensis TaxID=2799577 RepID=UPI0022DFD908|nr:hypothetical protein [Lacticaseibacillus suilingensis]MCI1893963.1 hypothetical protein [Lactobacillus sp.]MCI1918435.1 hypothetical protein [Lactobacillus sp.]MCI1941821.1 hypothetical protein [Lactobacillus sp.]MCI1972597.1 hypothetical protein [Lactobacillus sp.]MCI2017486.1 hypothetical protein [Lactobacillus sp.]